MQNFIFVSDIWAITDVKLCKTSQQNQYEIKLANKVYGFYCPYLAQTPIQLKVSARFALATVSLGHSNNWVVCEMSVKQSGNCKATNGNVEAVSIEVLKKIGVLATDSCSELFVHAGTPRSRLSKIHCLFI